jgi:hypothetical protein
MTHQTNLSKFTEHTQFSGKKRPKSANKEGKEKKTFVGVLNLCLLLEKLPTIED